MSQTKITESALVKRINRKLQADDLRLKKYDDRWRDSWRYGPYYIVNTQYNVMNDYGISDLEGLGREVGALRKSEKL